MFYSWGCGHDGRLGTGKEENSNQPTLVDIIGKTIYRKIIVAASKSTASTVPPATAASTDNSDTVRRKKNAFGIVVDEDVKEENEEKKIKIADKDETNNNNNDNDLPYFPLKVNRVFCGGYHTFVECVLFSSSSSSEQQEQQQNQPNALLLAFGGNEFGQLGLGDSSPRMSAQCVEPFFNPFGNVQFVSKEKQHDYEQRRQEKVVATMSKSYNEHHDDDLGEQKEDEYNPDNSDQNQNNTKNTKLLQNLPSKTRKRNTRGEAFDISQTPYLWYNSNDLIDIKCGRYHSMALMKVKTRNDEHEQRKLSLFVCGRNDSGQLGFGAGDRDHKSAFLEADLSLLDMFSSEDMSQTSTSSSSSPRRAILDASCGAYHSLLLLGPKKCLDFIFEESTSSSVADRIHKWILNEIETETVKLITKTENTDDENNNLDQHQQRRQVIRSIKSQFKLYACGRGDAGELGINGNENDTRADVESRIKSAIDRQHHRKKMMGNEGNSSSATAGNSSWALHQQHQQQQNNNNENNIDENNIENQQQDEDETISSILDPSKRSQYLKKHQKLNDKRQFRVSLVRDMWTIVDIFEQQEQDDIRLKFSDVNDNNDKDASSLTSISIPIRLHASYCRSAVEVVRFIVAADQTSSSSISRHWLTFGCFYHNKRETIDSSTPTEVVLPPTLDHLHYKYEIKHVTAIEDAEILWMRQIEKEKEKEQKTEENEQKTQDLIFVRGGPRSYIIPSFGSDCSGDDAQQDFEDGAGESVEWCRLQIQNKKPKTINIICSSGSDGTNNINNNSKVVGIFCGGKNFTVQLECVGKKKTEEEDEKVMTEKQRKIRPTSASSSKSQQNDDDDDDDGDDRNISFSNHYYYFLSFGENFYGQLGVADDNDRGNGKCSLVSSRFFEGEEVVIEKEKFISLACGASHCGMSVGF